MNAYKLNAIIAKEGILVLKGLPFHVGETVEIIILEEPTTSSARPLVGRVLRYDDPFEPAVPAENWEVLK